MTIGPGPAELSGYDDADPRGLADTADREARETERAARSGSSDRLTEAAEELRVRSARVDDLDIGDLT